jgi:uncharacterized spore protein YtfJ
MIKCTRFSIRLCHHVTNKDKQIAALYRELGEYHFRDSLLAQSNLLKQIQELENNNNKNNNNNNNNNKKKN